MNAPRKFEILDPEESMKRLKTLPLLLGIVGPSSSGKTWSALRLAAGIQRVTGGTIYVIDTESNRALHYKQYFKFKHVPFSPPHGPLDYLAAIEQCRAHGPGPIVIDSMTHEHSGEGGVMDQSRVWLDQQAGDDQKKREKLFQNSLVRPKAERNRLNRAIVQMGINAIFCYRAHSKVKPVTGAGVVDMGWQPETTSPIHYDMAARFLLQPGSSGRPMFEPRTEAEREMVKLPRQFQGWFKQGDQLTEDLGEKMSRWAAGGADAPEVISTYTAPVREGEEIKAVLREIQEALIELHPGGSTEAKEGKRSAVVDVFGVRSWREVEGFSLDALREGLATLRSGTSGRSAGQPGEILSAAQVKEIRALVERSKVSLERLEESFGGPLEEVRIPGLSARELEAELVREVKAMVAAREAEGQLPLGGKG